MVIVWDGVWGGLDGLSDWWKLWVLSMSDGRVLDGGR